MMLQVINKSSNYKSNEESININYPNKMNKTENIQNQEIKIYNSIYEIENNIKEINKSNMRA
jgi:hypothetical protein